jgi:hypothetical protein
MVSRDGTPGLIVIRKLHRMRYALESSMPWWPIRSREGLARSASLLQKRGWSGRSWITDDRM